MEFHYSFPYMNWLLFDTSCICNQQRQQSMYMYMYMYICTIMYVQYVQCIKRFVAILPSFSRW